MKPEDAVTIKDIQKPRTPQELSSWCESTHARIRRIEKKHENPDVFQYTKALKIFRCEVMPLEIFLTKKGNPDHYYSIVCGNQNYDALEREDGKTIKKYEICEAIDGHTESLRLKELQRKGHVSAYADVNYSGSKNKGHYIDIQDNCYEPNDMVEKTIALLRKSFLKKAEKKYDSDTEIIFIFDDWFTTKIEEFNDAYRSFLLKESMVFEETRQVHLISWQRKLFISRF